MTDIFIYIFYILLFIPINSFIFYPLVIFILSKFVKTSKYDKNNLPKVSLLIAAYNEEKVIEERLRNIEKLDYDFSKIEVHIGSDCSSDKTNEILLNKQSEYTWLKIHLFKERRGKASVLNDLIEFAKNDIVVFSDANTEFDKDALKNLVYQFQDNKIGGVCGKLILTDTEVAKTAAGIACIGNSELAKSGASIIEDALEHASVLLCCFGTPLFLNVCAVGGFGTGVSRSNGTFLF